MTRFKYPENRRDETAVDEYHGVKVKDPYRWLEDPYSEETKKWVEEENHLTEEFFNTHCQVRGQIADRLKEMYNYEKIGTPFKRGGKYYMYKNDGLQNQFILYSQDTLDAPAKVFLDPNKLSTDGTAALGATAFSKKATDFFAYGVSRSGSDWETIHIKNVESGEDLPERLEWCKFTSIAWKHDSSGFFYSRYPVPRSLKKRQEEAAPSQEHAAQNGAEHDERGSEVDQNAEQKVYFHRIGTPQSEDELIYASPENPKWLWSLTVTHDGEYLLISAGESTERVNRLYYVKLSEMKKDENGHVVVVKLIDNFEAEYAYITNEGSLFYFQTNLDAPRGRVICIDFNNPSKDNWKEILPHSKDVLKSILCVNQKYLLTEYMHNVQSVLRLYSLSGELVKELPIVPNGSILGISGRKEDSEFFYKFTSLLLPGTVFRYDFKTDEITTFYETKIKGVDFSNFESKQVWYTSKDGTKVPMFIVSKKGMALDGNNPTLLYGYGGFNISLSPYFSAFRLAFVQHFNGVFAMPNIRGGGEFGEEWHKAGIIDKKQNVFDDFIAAAEYLIANKYTSPSKLAIQGGSNGGLLIGACTNQRPDLFAAAQPQVGVMDMLKFHKFTIGYAWVSDYGSSDNKDQFEALIKYSPLHNIRPPADANVQYPAVLVTTSDHDDRVVPLHSFKYAAELQHTIGSLPQQTRPLLIRIETKAGHGAGKPTTKVIEECADVYAFFAYALEAQWQQ